MARRKQATEVVTVGVAVQARGGAELAARIEAAMAEAAQRAAEAGETDQDKIREAMLAARDEVKAAVAAEQAAAAEEAGE